MFKQYLKRRQDAIDAGESKISIKSLFNEKTFYSALIRDMLQAKQEVIIYSPFVSKFRTDCLKPTIAKLKYRNIDVFIFTRPLEEYDNIIRTQIEVALKRFEEMGVNIFYPGRYIHEKVAIIDRQILWEGSLNILSHRASNEMMRRIESKESSAEVMEHININPYLSEAYKTKYERMCSDLKRNSNLNFQLKMKIFLVGMAVPLIVWLIVGLVDLRPVQIYTSLVNSVIVSLRH
jgi:phosphatidylserine/phosphatidylglycerophosphate/cardiolipin synthase-like enzyme